MYIVRGNLSYLPQLCSASLLCLCLIKHSWVTLLRKVQIYSYHYSSLLFPVEMLSTPDIYLLPSSLSFNSIKTHSITRKAVVSFDMYGLVWNSTQSFHTTLIIPSYQSNWFFSCTLTDSSNRKHNWRASSNQEQHFTKFPISDVSRVFHWYCQTYALIHTIWLHITVQEPNLFQFFLHWIY